MSEWTKEKLEKIYVDVQKKCATDKEFRDEILKDANSAIEKLTGETIPEGFKLKAVEQDPNYTATFIIPDLISEELTEGDMQKMAAGPRQEEWEAFMAVFQQCEPGQRSDEKWKRMERIF